MSLATFSAPLGYDMMVGLTLSGVLCAFVGGLLGALACVPLALATRSKRR
jgi:hypothetical protein